MVPDDRHKQRLLVFYPLPCGQAQAAAALLGCIDRLKVRCEPDGLSLRVEYDLPEFTLQGIEEFLTGCGFHLDSSLLSRLRRALVHYCEEVQCENLAAEGERSQKSREIWVQAYEHHPHGNADETPEEWRAYR
jgi:hypothetical protein